MFGWLKKKTLKEGRMYDFRYRGWGHSIEWLGDGKKKDTHKLCGWVMPRVCKGDTFLFPATKGLAVWFLLDVENCRDPRDMFFATAGIIRYATEADIKKAVKGGK